MGIVDGVIADAQFRRHQSLATPGPRSDRSVEDAAGQQRLLDRIARPPCVHHALDGFQQKQHLLRLQTRGNRGLGVRCDGQRGIEYVFGHSAILKGFPHSIVRDMTRPGLPQYQFISPRCGKPSLLSAVFQERYQVSQFLDGQLFVESCGHDGNAAGVDLVDVLLG